MTQISEVQEAVQHLEQAIALLEQVPGIRPALWVDHFRKDLGSLGIMALASEPLVEA